MRILLLIFVIQFRNIATFPNVKRQGILGLCQGWGAGCASYHIPKPRKYFAPPSISIPKSRPDVSLRPPSFFFTSGESWNPIGKRTAWYTDIPFLRNPLLKYPPLDKSPANQLSWRFPLMYRSAYRQNRYPKFIQE